MTPEERDVQNALRSESGEAFLGENEYREALMYAQLTMKALAAGKPVRDLDEQLSRIERLLDGLTPPPEAGASTPPEARLNDDGTLDEIVATGCNFHLEQMDFNHWWLEVYQSQGVGISVWLQAKTKIRASTEKRTYGRDASYPPQEVSSAALDSEPKEKP